MVLRRVLYRGPTQESGSEAQFVAYDDDGEI
jgi:hypothetical protein